MYRQSLQSSEQPPLHIKGEHGLSKQKFLLILSWEIKQRNFQSLSGVVSTPGNMTTKTNQNASYDKLKGKRDKRNREVIKRKFSGAESLIIKNNKYKTTTIPAPPGPPQTNKDLWKNLPKWCTYAYKTERALGQTT